MTDDGVEVRWRFRRRTARIVGVVAGVVVLVGAWWVVAAQGTVETGSSTSAAGYSDECQFGDDDRADSTDRVTIPPGREAAMWIVEPFPEDGTMLDGMSRWDDRLGIDGADVQVRSLGLPHDTRVEFHGALWQSELDLDSAAFQRQLAEMCVDDE